MWWFLLPVLVLVIWLLTQGFTGWAWPVLSLAVAGAVVLARIKGGKVK